MLLLMWTGCTWIPADFDGDGVRFAEDCDDRDAAGSTPVTWYVDGDDDGAGDPAQAQQVCVEADLPELAVGRWVLAAGDCDDAVPTVFAGAIERCDGLDNDCDPQTPRDVPTGSAADTGGIAYLPDHDRDGFPAAGTPVLLCPSSVRPGLALASIEVDCDDDSASIRPDAPERCNGVDDDCDGLVDDEDDAEDPVEWWTDADQDGYGDGVAFTACAPGPLGLAAGGPIDCDDAASAVNPGAVEVHYDGLDANCDPDDDDDADLDGFPGGIAGTDCDDQNTAVNPGAGEVPYDGIDQNCDPLDDDDADGDGFAAVSAGGHDCDDTLAAVNPGAPEVYYDDLDNDCGGPDDDDQDGDGFDLDARGGTDCDDLDPERYPRERRVPIDFPTLEEAIDDACSGGTLLLAEGTYTGPFNLGMKDLTLQGEGTTTVLTGQTGDYTLSAASVTIADLTFTGTTGGLSVIGDRATIERVRFEDVATTTSYPLRTVVGALTLQDVVFVGNQASLVANVFANQAILTDVEWRRNLTNTELLLRSDDVTAQHLAFMDVTVRAVDIVNSVGVFEDVRFESAATGISMRGPPTSMVLRDLVSPGSVTGVIVADGASAHVDGFLTYGSDQLSSVAIRHESSGAFSAERVTAVGVDLLLHLAGPEATIDRTLCVVDQAVAIALSTTALLQLDQVYCDPYEPTNWADSFPAFDTDPMLSGANGVLTPRFITYHPSLDRSLWDLHLRPAGAALGPPVDCADPDGTACDPGFYSGPDADFSYYADLDADGMMDGWEHRHGVDLAGEDPDADGLDNLQEFLAGTSPMLADTDHDGSNDGDDPLPLAAP